MLGKTPLREHHSIQCMKFPFAQKPFGPETDLEWVPEKKKKISVLEKSQKHWSLKGGWYLEGLQSYLGEAGLK